MKHVLHAAILSALVVTGCTGARLSHEEARRKIAEIGTSQLVPQAVEIRRIVSQTEDQAIAESTVTLAFQFKREQDGEWRIDAVRLGDRQWFDLNELLAAIDEGRRRETTTALQKVVAGIGIYLEIHGSMPEARDFVGLTDTLHPRYMKDLVRLDAWGNPIDLEVSGGVFRLISSGPDGLRGSADDIVVTTEGVSGP